jgi:hypothetical protein
LFLHVGTTKSCTRPRIYDYNDKLTAGYSLSKPLSNSPGTQIRWLSSSVESHENASYVLINDQNEIFWVRADHKNQYVVSKISANFRGTSFPGMNTSVVEREQIEQISVAMPSKEGVLIFWHDHQSRGYVTKANVRTGDGIWYKLSLELSA